MIEAAHPGLEAGDAVPQAHPTGELHKEQVHELIPAGKRASRPPYAISFLQAEK